MIWFWIFWDMSALLDSFSSFINLYLLRYHEKLVPFFTYRRGYCRPFNHRFSFLNSPTKIFRSAYLRLRSRQASASKKAVRKTWKNKMLLLCQASVISFRTKIDMHFGEKPKNWNIYLEDAKKRLVKTHVILSKIKNKLFE